MPRPTKAQLLEQLQATRTRLAEVEETSRRMGKLLEMVGDAVSGAILLLNEQGQIVQAQLSRQWSERLGLSSLVGQSLAALVSPPALNSLEALLTQVRQQQRSAVLEQVSLRQDPQGVYEWFLSYQPEMGVLAIVRRVEPVPTSLVELPVPSSSEPLTRANRLMRLGELVASLVHELNQPLTAILHYGQGCLRRLNNNFPAQDLRHASHEIIQQAQRAIQIIERVRRFLRGQELPIGPVDLNAVVRESVSLLASEIATSKVELQWQLSPTISPIHGDAVQLTQVLVNLVRNALEALANHPQPRIIVATRSTPDYVEVSVADNGPGLGPEVQSRLFEPFFSTKPQGLGMGLAVSRSIVEGHGGTLLAENWEGGARFIARFPVPAQETGQPP